MVLLLLAAAQMGSLAVGLMNHRSQSATYLRWQPAASHSYAMFNPLPSKELTLGFSMALGWQLVVFALLVAAFWLIDRKELPHPILVSLLGVVAVSGSAAFIDELWGLVGVGFSEYVLRVFGVGALTFVNSALVSVHAFRSRTTRVDCAGRTGESYDALSCRPHSAAVVVMAMATPIIFNLVRWISELQH